mmetsp:Transcript_148635/g.360799  ORF Transcript_148635/g.360799 Transcript_148635/m.360799 type:complete len:81 (-) Transcript_148635:658-900(-)
MKLLKTTGVLCLSFGQAPVCWRSALAFQTLAFGGTVWRPARLAQHSPILQSCSVVYVCGAVRGSQHYKLTQTSKVQHGGF